MIYIDMAKIPQRIELRTWFNRTFDVRRGTGTAEAWEATKKIGRIATEDTAAVFSSTMDSDEVPRAFATFPWASSLSAGVAFQYALANQQSALNQPLIFRGL
jgi:hypothetical protein